MSLDFDKITKLDGWLSRNEGRVLYQLAKSLTNDSMVVEIGSFQGKSTICLAQALKEKGSGRVYSVDPHLGQTHQGEKEFSQTYSSFLKNIKNFKVSDFVAPIRKKSLEAAKNWKKPIDLLHIDGLHEYKYVKQDLGSWIPYLIDGGVLVCHDAFTPEPDVFRAIEEEVIQSGQFCYLAPNDSQIIAIKGKPTGIWQKINYWRQVYFVTLACQIWQNPIIDYNLRYFLVNRVLKLFFLNKFMIESL